MNYEKNGGLGFSDVSKRRVIGRAIVRYCQVNSISKAELSRRLGAPYQTVASWWRVRGVSVQQFVPSARWCERIVAEIPVIAEGSYPAPSSLKNALQFRVRHIPDAALARAHQRVGRAFERLDMLVRLGQLSLTSIKGMSPDDLRKLLGVGNRGSIYSVEQAIERLGIPIVHVDGEGTGNGGRMPIVSLVTCLGRAAVLLVGPASGSPEQRHALVSELGFYVVDPKPRAAARRHRVNEFADEFLLPKVVLREAIPSATKQIQFHVLKPFALGFGVPIEAVARQVRRLWIEVVDRSDDLTGTPESYLDFLASQSRLPWTFFEND